MKLYALTTQDGSPLPATCLCERHHADSKHIIQPPPMVSPDSWADYSHLGNMRCIWCGAQANDDVLSPSAQRHNDNRERRALALDNAAFCLQNYCTMASTQEKILIEAAIAAVKDEALGLRQSKIITLGELKDPFA